MFVVTVNHTFFWGFVWSILLSLNIISIIVCAVCLMFKVMFELYIYLLINVRVKFHGSVCCFFQRESSVVAGQFTYFFDGVWCSLLAALL